jgi:hypothetical protein
MWRQAELLGFFGFGAFEEREGKRKKKKKEVGEHHFVAYITVHVLYLSMYR